MSNNTARKIARTQARPGSAGAASVPGSPNRMIWIAVAVIVVIAVAVGVGVALSGGGDEGETGVLEVGFAETIGDTLPPHGEGDDPAIGTPAPTLRAASVLTGDVVDVVADDGKAKIIGFFAHWCPHCQAELPRIVDRVTAEPLPEGVEMIAVSTAVNQGRPNYPASAWFDRENWPYEVLVDTEDGAAASGFGLNSFPYFVVVGPDGDVVTRVSGELSSEQLDALIDTAAASLEAA